MRHQNSVLHGILEHVPWSMFDRLVETHQADARVRRLTTKTQFVAMVHAHLSGASSLREIVDGLKSHAPRLYHLGVAAPKRSTLSDANAIRPAALFCELFGQMVQQAHRGLRRAMAGTTYLIDATILPLSALCASWARFSASSCGAKAHLIYDPDADCPVFFSLTAANVPDIVAAKEMPIAPGSTYVFDKGFYDYAWWAKLDAADCRFVTRLKANTPFTVEQERFLEPGGAILSDRIGYLPKRLAASRHNPMAKPVRVVEVVDDAGKILRILTNDLRASAEEIADLYKRRWAIELFFRWIKQTLKIRHFLGTTENAVRIQIAVALITFLLLRLAQQAAKVSQSLLTFARLVRANLMHRRPLNRLLDHGPDPEVSSNQLAIQWT